MNFFAKNLIYCRKLFGVTQTQLALHLDRGQSTVGGWENKISEPSVEALVKISGFFGISIEHLIKTDLESSNLVTKEHVENFRRKGKAPGKVNSKDSPLLVSFEVNELSPEYGSKNADQLKVWTLMQVLKEIDRKLDHLLVLAESKNKNKPK